MKKSNIFLSDYLVNKLVPDNSNKLIFSYSRIFCDVEKFKDDKKERMSKKGMGVLYTKDLDNTIAIINKKYKNKILKSYYDKYHNKLDKKVINIIHKYNKCLIIDLHSFSEEMVYKLFHINNSPDICIGIDYFYTSKKLLDFTIKHFESYDYKVKIDYPYSGTIIPNKFINKKDVRLNSIMIEINKKIYLNNKEDFYKLKDCIHSYYINIQELNI